MNNVLYERLEKRFGKNEPIFLSEIPDEIKEYSESYVYLLLKEADKEGKVIKTLKGVYYIPTNTPIGKSEISINQIVEKKYLRNGDEVFGIGGRNILDLNFFINTQVPYTIELISNKETQKVRKYKIEKNTYLIRRSRTTITKDNYAAYTLCELFNSSEVYKFKIDENIWDAIIRYIKKEKITKNQIEDLIDYFPKRSKRYIEESGLYDEIT